MALVTQMQATQLNVPSSGNCQVKVEWVFGNQLPDVVEIYVTSPGSTSPAMLAERVAIRGDRSRNSTVINLLAGTVWRLGVCPRQLEDDGTTLKDKTNSREWGEHYWETFCMVQDLVTRVDVPEPQSTQRIPAPIIEEVDVAEGQFKVRWRGPSCTHHNIRVGQRGVPVGQAEIGGSAREYTVRRTIGGATYVFAIQSCHRSTFLGIRGASRCSDWASVEVKIPAEQGWKPWAGGTPGGGIAVGRQKAAQQTVILHVGLNGAVYLTWPEDTRELHWNNPVEISASHFARPGAHLAVCQQTDQVFTALVIDRGGVPQVLWVDETGPWQGPAPIGEGHFIPGGCVALAKQTDHLMTALLVDHEGAVNVAWVEGVSAWHPPVRITQPGFTAPGARVALAKQTDTILTGLVTDAAGCLSAMWVIGTGSWQGPVRISSPNMFEPFGGLAMTKQTDDLLTAIAIDKEGIPRLTWVVGTGTWQNPNNTALELVSQSTSHAGLALGGGYRLSAAVVDADEQLEAAWVVGIGAWSVGIKLGPAGFAPAGAEVGTSGRVFAVANSNNGLTTFQLTSGSWTGPRHV